MHSLIGNQFQALCAQLPATASNFGLNLRSTNSFLQLRGSSSKLRRTNKTADSLPVICPESLDYTLSSLQQNEHLMQLISASKLKDVLKTLFPSAGLTSPWTQTSYISAPTFFENKYGFSPSTITSSPTTQQIIFHRAFLSTNSSACHTSVRGFKSKRYNQYGGYSFGKKTEPASSDFGAEFFGAVGQQGVREERLDSASSPEFLQYLGKKNGDKSLPELSRKEKDRLHAELLAYKKGFIFGKEEAKDGDGKRKSIVSFASIVVFVLMALYWSGVLPLGRQVKYEITPEDVKVTFEDVKGVDEAKQELQEIVDFLMNPDKFSALGGKLPRGCLLVGPPGTGKTLLARAVAGQAGVPFFHAAGSEFDEVLVGQGARRIRNLFQAAKARAPCVIFIDEIDAVASRRTASELHPYANQTVNQLLAEMDGFVSNEGVVVLGATNRAEDLDRALLRPRRFDTRVTVPNPDIRGRKEILQLYLGKVTHDDSVDVEKLAKMTVGFSGADLENLVNTAAIRAAVEGKRYVTMAEFEYSHDKHVLGTDWKSRIRDNEDLKITAYHEAGHTLVAFFTKEALPLHKVTIVAKGQSGGHTAFMPEKDRSHETKAQMLAAMDVSMGGRAAEELIFGKDKVTGGASADLQSATGVAEYMVKRVGMSEKIGLRVFPSADGYNSSNVGPGTYELIDSEVNKLMDDAYARALAILRAHRKELDMLAEALLRYETLDVEDIKSIVGGDTASVAKRMSTNSVFLKQMARKKQLAATASIGSGKVEKPNEKLPSGPEILVQ